MDITPWLGKITSPALVLGGDEDIMTPWDQGPDGVGQEGIYQGIAGAEKHVIEGGGHSTIFDSPTSTTASSSTSSSGTPRPRRRGRSHDGVVPAVEEYGVEPIPAELRTAGWRDLFAINFTFFLNPVMYLLGRLRGRRRRAAAPVGDRRDGRRAGARVRRARRRSPQPGVDYGLPGQVAMRATLGFWGARLLSSPYRVVAATYWFAAQALTGALGIQALVEAMPGHHLPLVPIALALAAFHATLAVLGFDVMRWLLRVVLPISLAFTAVLVGLYLASGRPALRRRARLRLAGPAPDLGRLRDVRDRDGGRVADAGRRTSPTSAATRRRGGTCGSASSPRRSSPPS